VTPSQNLLASGFFLANTGLQISSQKPVGCLVCRSGDIDVSGRLLHYPLAALALAARLVASLAKEAAEAKLPATA